MATRQRGFTLPELLVAGGVLALLFVAAAVLLSPATPDTSAQRDTERRLGLARLMQGFAAYYAKNGDFPASVSAEEKFIGAGQNEANLCNQLVPEHINQLPFDPAGGSGTLSSCPAEGQDYTTAYAVKIDGTTLTLAAPLTETQKEIKLSRSF